VTHTIQEYTQCMLSHTDTRLPVPMSQRHLIRPREPDLCQLVWHRLWSCNTLLQRQLWSVPHR